ncbi:NUDIX hydrolase [Telmatospirillum siberiense]|uniref:NUDIX hydrolase n=1 Tax=Telmatospirillum siberiense TaxID=382514 RepID=UPI0018EC7FFE|nr:NUDIX hydrolase [Telmatospirillum siberiense]
MKGKPFVKDKQGKISRPGPRGSHRQAGVIPYVIEQGEVKILLVTSRDTGRWVIPKGNIGGGRSAAEAAVKEAEEEAGVKGRISTPLPLGFFPYFKRLASGEARATTVEVYPLLVTATLETWPEKDQRRLCWVSAWEAARMVDEPGLARMMIRLVEIIQAEPREASDPLRPDRE